MKTRIIILASLMLMLVGFLIAWEIYRPKPPKPEPPAPAVRQRDGSLILERAPSGLSSKAPAGSSPLEPAQELPKGAKVERLVQVTVDPTEKPSTLRYEGSAPEGLPTPSVSAAVAPTPQSSQMCPPVTVDLSLVRMPDKTQRVLASSPNGTVVGGIDVPKDLPEAPKVQRWTVQALAGYDSHVGRNVFGGQFEYSKGPVVFSGGVVGGTAFVGAGIRF